MEHNDNTTPPSEMNIGNKTYILESFTIPDHELPKRDSSKESCEGFISPYESEIGTADVLFWNGIRANYFVTKDLPGGNIMCRYSAKKQPTTSELVRRRMMSEYNRKFR